MLAYARLLLALSLLKLRWHVYTTFRFLMKRAPKVCPCFLNFEKSYSVSIQRFGLFSIMGIGLNLVPLIFLLMESQRLREGCELQKPFLQLLPFLLSSYHLWPC